MNIYLKKSISLIACICLLLSVISLSGCKAEDFNLYFGVDALPNSIDPQRAETYSERLAVKNCFSALTKIDENGAVVLDAAESYSVSRDGLNYTFKLKNQTWSNKNSVTAYDFLFAIKRAVTPDTKAVGITNLKNIAGALALLNNENTELGVYAENEKEIRFELINPDDDFLKKLSEPIFMPCNQKFFEGCGGKYGLGTNYIISNGDFIVSAWNESSYVKLKRRYETDASITQAKAVYLSKSASDKDSVTRITDGEVGITINSQNDYSKAEKSSKLSVITQYRENYCLIFNKNNEVGTNSKLTEALAKSIHREYYTTRLPERFKPTEIVFPEDSYLKSEILNKRVELSPYTYSYNSVEARNLFIEALKEFKNGKLPKISILTVDNAEIKAVLTDVIAKWQSELGAYVNISTVSSHTKLLNEIENGNYTIAFIPLSANVVETLELFTSKGGATIADEEYDQIINELNSTFNTDESANLIKKASEKLSYQTTIIPICSVPTAIIWENKYKNVIFNKEDLTIDFSIIYK